MNEWINQSINQSTNQNQSIKSINQSINQSVNQVKSSQVKSSQVKSINHHHIHYHLLCDPPAGWFFRNITVFFCVVILFYTTHSNIPIWRIVSVFSAAAFLFAGCILRQNLVGGSWKIWGRQWGLFFPIPSGKRLHNYGKLPFLMGKSTINGHFPLLC